MTDKLSGGTMLPNIKKYVQTSILILSLTTHPYSSHPFIYLYPLPSLFSPFEHRKSAIVICGQQNQQERGPITSAGVRPKIASGAGNTASGQGRNRPGAGLAGESRGRPSKSVIGEGIRGLCVMDDPSWKTDRQDNHLT